MLSHGLLPKITVPTRLVHDKGTLIDHIFTKLVDNDKCVSGTLKSYMTDHFMNFIFIEHYEKPIKTEYVTYKYFTDKNISNFNRALSTCDMSYMYETEDVNTAYDFLLNKYTSLYNEHIPLKKARFDKYKHKKEAWVTTEILQSIKFRDKLHAKINKSKDTAQILVLKEQYIVCRNRLNKMIRSAKFNYQTDLFDKCKHDCKQIWANINMVLKKTRNKCDLTV